MNYHAGMIEVSVKSNCRLMVNPHRESVARLALPLPLEYIVMLGNGVKGGGIDSQASP